MDIFAGGLDATLVARILPLAKALMDFGVQCKVVLPIAWDRIAKGKLGNILSIAVNHLPNEYAETIKNPPDVVIIGRVSTPQIFLLQKFLKSRGLKTMFDLDDAIFLANSRVFGVAVRPGSFCLEGMIKNADFTTVNGHFLLRYARFFNEKTTIIHDPVDTRLFFPTSRKGRGKVTIGWEGVPRSHYENLSILIKPLSKLAQEYDVRLKIVSYLGDLKVKRIYKELESRMEIDYGPTQWVPMSKIASMISDFDIMVAPLQNIPWYHGKSAQRVGLGMAIGVPVVASPIGEQKHVIDHGVNGFLAKNQEEWYDCLRLLIENDKLRREIGHKGRETAENELSLRVCGKKFYDIVKGLTA